MSAQVDNFGNATDVQDDEVRDPRLTHSRMRCARKCMRLHYWLYECGLRPLREATPLRIGSIYHRGLELMGTLERDEAIAEACAPYDQGPPAGSSEDAAHSWWVERATVACLLAGHHWRWSTADETEPVIATETAFDIPLVNPTTGRPSRTWRLCGKRDAIVGTDGDRKLIREYKTTSDEIDISTPSGEVFWSKLRMDSQVSTYWIAALAEGLQVGGVIYDVTRKPTIRPCQVSMLDNDGRKIVTDDATGLRVWLTQTPQDVAVLDPNGLKIVIEDATGERAMTKGGAPRLTAGFGFTLRTRVETPDELAKRCGSPKPRQSAGPGLTLQSRSETPEEFGERLWADIIERPDHYYARREIPRLQCDLDEAGMDMWRMARTLREAQLEARTLGKAAWPRNTDSCTAYGRCSCWGLCTGDYDPDRDPVPEGWQRVDDVHPELSEED